MAMSRNRAVVVVLSSFALVILLFYLRTKPKMQLLELSETISVTCVAIWDEESEEYIGPVVLPEDDVRSLFRTIDIAEPCSSPLKWMVSAGFDVKMTAGRRGTIDMFVIYSNDNRDARSDNKTLAWKINPGDRYYIGGDVLLYERILFLARQ